MFKFKVLAAAFALGLSGAASADVTGGSTGNTEFVFSAFDTMTGKGYSFDLTDLGFDDIYGSNVRMNSLIGSTNTASTIGTTLLQTPANRIVFDALLPEFDQVASGDLQWNLVSAEVSSIRRIVQTVGSTPTSALSNSQIITGANNFDQYIGAVNGKMPGTSTADDGYALTVAADGLAYAGTVGSTFGGNVYASTGKLGDVLNMFVVSSTTTTSSTTAGRYAQLLDTQGQAVVAKVYQGVDGYHLQIAAVPEPSTYAMLLAGLGLLGLAARRHRA